MKILWLSNAVLSVGDRASTGTWLDAMAQLLVLSGEVTLGNISSDKVMHLARQDCGSIKQWIVPLSTPSNRSGLPSQKVVADILQAVKEFSPDLVHVWGTESYWGLITENNKIGFPSLLEIQGLKGPYSRVFSGGLTKSEQHACIGFKELIKRRSISAEGKKYEAWGRFEREVIAGHRFITTQSPWVEAWVRASNRACRVFHTELVLRDLFYRAEPWCLPSSTIIFCSAAYPVPYKGLHDAIRVLSVLKSAVPKVRLRIAGAHQFRGIRQDGYIAWVNRLARSLGVSTQIDWLGSLTAEEIVQELQNCSVMLMPSHCETYCVALAEAIYLGVPTVTAYTGGSAWLARDGESALFFPPGDEAMCAWQIERILTDRDLAIRLSHNARTIAQVRNNPETVVKNQLEIYRQVIVSSNTY